MGNEFISQITSEKDSILFAIRCLPAILAVTVMQFFIYELVSNVISGVLLGVLVTVATSYVSGFFFPIYTLPSAVRGIAEFLPTKAAFDCVGNALRGSMEISNILLCVIFSALLFALACAVRQVKLRRLARD